jgi:hypothetical protein
MMRKQTSAVVCAVLVISFLIAWYLQGSSWYVIPAIISAMAYIGLKEPIKHFEIARLIGSTLLICGIALAFILGRWWLAPIAVIVALAFEILSNQLHRE